MGCDWYTFTSMLACGLFFNILQTTAPQSDDEDDEEEVEMHPEGEASGATQRTTFSVDLSPGFVLKTICDNKGVVHCLLTLDKSVVDMGSISTPGPYNIETHHAEIKQLTMPPRFQRDEFQIEFDRLAKHLLGVDSFLFGEFSVLSDSSYHINSFCTITESTFDECEDDGNVEVEVYECTE